MGSLTSKPNDVFVSVVKGRADAINATDKAILAAVYAVIGVAEGSVSPRALLPLIERIADTTTRDDVMERLSIIEGQAEDRNG